ncbi:MAG: hypothetical protein CVV42_03220 [Candidatus Riflebacteria bacterium HGW-Riflebacteria-2]|jgi:prepilin-type N-terminal cleavage/methylation domain-containing protein|nr:MAG: hypothetical protein CVV42_03220 [Candidatus Riflebacteria bacterium HGW-Riflebacteria-2]
MKRFSADGFSFIEILAALVIFGLFLIPMIPGFGEIRRQSVDARRMVIAGALAASKLEEMKLADRIDSAMMQSETRSVHGIDFRISPAFELIDPAAGFENARPAVFSYRLRVRVKWARPGLKESEHDFSLQAIVFRNRLL